MNNLNTLHLLRQQRREINITDNNSAPVTSDGGYLLCPCCGGTDMRQVSDGVTLDGDGVSIEMNCPDDCGDATLDVTFYLGAAHLSWRNSKRGRKGA